MKIINLIVAIAGLLLMAVLFGAAGWFLHSHEWGTAAGFGLFGLFVSYQLLRSDD